MAPDAERKDLEKAEVEERKACKRARWQEYREQYQKEQMGSRKHKAEMVKAGGYEIFDVLLQLGNVHMSSFCGTEGELAYFIEKLYANDGRDFDPTIKYLPSMLSSFKDNYAMHARGIYYRDYFSDALVEYDRKVWIPSLSDDRSHTPELPDQRAQIVADHTRENERWVKSEYAWDADAWSDMFGLMRDDPYVAMHKHRYITLLAETDPITCHLNGNSTMVDRRPDVTFGLATYSDREAMLPFWVPELQAELLERLMSHPKYGLVSDPNPESEDIGLSFPFMVYESKGWNGDCRVARYQACSAAAVYLDMLDHLARRPGQVDSPRPYQTNRSHQYQVFVLTSFGAHWHLLVGYRRPRSLAEHAGEHGVSETVYIFQKLWSGRVTNGENARQLLCLIEQIQNWAVTEHRRFVIDHLKPWHQLCAKNYLLEWDSKYDVPDYRKRERVAQKTEDLLVPVWAAKFKDSRKRTVQDRAKASLEKYSERNFACLLNECRLIWSSEEVWADHLRQIHNLEDFEIASHRWLTQEYVMRMEIKARLEAGNTATGRRWPDHLMPNPFSPQDLEGNDLFLCNPAKRHKTC